LNATVQKQKLKKSLNLQIDGKNQNLPWLLPKLYRQARRKNLFSSLQETIAADQTIDGSRSRLGFCF
jgi:hypothetical protein